MARLLDFLTWGWRSYRRNLRWVVDFFKSRYLVGQARKHCCTFCIISYAVLQSASLCTIVRGRKARPSRRRLSWFAGESHATSISLRVYRVLRCNTWQYTHLRFRFWQLYAKYPSSECVKMFKKRRNLHNYLH